MGADRGGERGKSTFENGQVGATANGVRPAGAKEGEWSKRRWRGRPAGNKRQRMRPAKVDMGKQAKSTQEPGPSPRLQPRAEAGYGRGLAWDTVRVTLMVEYINKEFVSRELEDDRRQARGRAGERMGHQ